jgi:hypothetical protein
VTATCDEVVEVNLDGECGTVDKNIYDANNSGDALTGGSANLCAAGTVTNFMYSGTTHEWSWECRGAYSGETQSCSSFEEYC